MFQLVAFIRVIIKHTAKNNHALWKKLKLRLKSLLSIRHFQIHQILLLAHFKKWFLYFKSTTLGRLESVLPELLTFPVIDYNQLIDLQMWDFHLMCSVVT